MDIPLWIVQVLLALAFGLAGFAHTFRYEQSVAQPQMAWIADLPRPVVGVLGVVELLGAIGLVLPAATGILPWLTPLAATGLALMMVLGAVFHLARREAQEAVVTLILGALAAFVAYGRFALAPFD